MSSCFVKLSQVRHKSITPPMRVAMSMSMRCVDVDGDGVVKYNELVDFFCDVMMHMERGARVRAALDAAKRRSNAADADDLKRTKALDDEKAEDAAEVRRAARALRLAQLRAECTKYLCALTSDNVYALYRDAVGLIARYVGDGSSSNLQKSETVTCTVCDVHAVELRRGTETRIGTVASQSQLLRVRVSTCADAVNGTMKRGDGASWPAVGYHTKIDEDEEDEGNGVENGLGVPVDIPELTQAARAVSLRAVRAVDGEDEPAGPVSAVVVGGGYFACPFRGGATRGYLAVDTAGDSFPTDKKTIAEDDKEIVRIVAECVGVALEEGFRAREGERSEKTRAALEKFDGEAEKKRREEEFLAKYRGK